MAHEKTVRYSPKREAEVLATLEAIVGTTTADAIRRFAEPTGNEQRDRD